MYRINEYNKINKELDSFKKGLKKALPGIDPGMLIPHEDHLISHEYIELFGGKKVYIGMEPAVSVFPSVSLYKGDVVLYLPVIPKSADLNKTIKNLKNYIMGTVGDNDYNGTYLHELVHVYDLLKGGKIDEEDRDTVNLCDYIKNPYEHKAISYELLYEMEGTGINSDSYDEFLMDFMVDLPPISVYEDRVLEFAYCNENGSFLFDLYNLYKML